MADQNQPTKRGESVRLEGVTRHFGDLKAVDGISVEIPKGSFFSLLGPSGCGKSTTLRIIAGFENPDAGKVFIGEKDVTGDEARLRPTVMVFQNYALFPHMTVRENVEYGLRVRKVATKERKRRVLEALGRVDMTAFVETEVTSLSGGQQQRIALARAIAIEPDVILFDEPLSNLDVALRQQTRIELKDLQRRLGLTSIYVTHDQEEALSLSDQIAVMRNGKIVQLGAPKDLYNEPATAFVASFLGGSNIVVDPEIAAHLTGKRLNANEAVAIRAEHMVFGAQGAYRTEQSLENEGADRLTRGQPATGPFEAEVISKQFLGMITEVELVYKGIKLTAKTTAAVPDEAKLSFHILNSTVVLNDL